MLTVSSRLPPLPDGRSDRRGSKLVGKTGNFDPVNYPEHQASERAKHAQKRDQGTANENAHSQADALARLRFRGKASFAEFAIQRFGQFQHYKEFPIPD